MDFKVCPRLVLVDFQTPPVLVGSFLCFSWLSPQALQETQSTWWGHGQAAGLARVLPVPSAEGCKC